ncbi:hypothetical protein GXM_03699 [Nostoc sphaeroides CCNUC1]|uniref:Uncharacterized protein n=1 Tax=Nostoc sphaeroides CCNUC1 TaxID=2653204 RepID=A0A5P8W2I1_9NOSO|nr:hypothetical protein GXM_03699 [Nostoc sphaeroides CCNUC1]
MQGAIATITRRKGKIFCSQEYKKTSPALVAALAIYIHGSS